MAMAAGHTVTRSISEVTDAEVLGAEVLSCEAGLHVRSPVGGGVGQIHEVCECEVGHDADDNRPEPGRGLGLQQQLARGLAANEILVRLARLLERVHRADPNVERPDCDQLEQRRGAVAQ